jgi:hypothetical protein
LLLVVADPLYLLRRSMEVLSANAGMLQCKITILSETLGADSIAWLMSARYLPQQACFDVAVPERLYSGPA